METKAVNKPIEIAYMLTAHDILTSEDYSSVEVIFKGLNKVDQVVILLDIVRSRVTSDPKLLENLKSIMNTPVESQEEEIQS